MIRIGILHLFASKDHSVKILFYDAVTQTLIVQILHEIILWSFCMEPRVI